MSLIHWTSIQALINRDEDYGRQLMLNPSDIPGSLTLSNPHPIGYVIGATGKENGMVYVDARLYLAYTANPYLQVVKERFYLEKTNSGYGVSQIEQLDDLQLYERQGTVFIEKNGERNSLFSIEDIKAIKNGVLRISSLAYDEQNGNVFFAIQTNSGLSIMAYKVDEKTFRDIVDIAGENTVAVDLSLSSDALYLAMNYGDSASAHVFLYDLQNKKEMIFEGMDRASGAFWAGDLLVFKANYEGWFIRWQLDPKTGKITL